MALPALLLSPVMKTLLTGGAFAAGSVGFDIGGELLGKLFGKGEAAKAAFERAKKDASAQRSALRLMGQDQRMREEVQGGSEEAEQGINTLLAMMGSSGATGSALDASSQAPGLEARVSDATKIKVPMSLQSVVGRSYI